MIADTAFLLIIAALFSGLKVNIKTDKIFSCLVFLFVGCIFSAFYQYSRQSVSETFSFVWNSSPSGNITVDIISNTYNFQLIQPFFLITLLSVGYNTIFRYEERRGVFNAVLLFNLFALIMMITSNNFVQLLSGLFAVDIMALLMIRDVEKSKYYAIYNLIADMILFTVLAVINCQLESLDIRQIVKYPRIGLHPDFAAVSGLLAIFIKVGIIPFHEGIRQLQDIRFHRLQSILFLTSPAAAVILLLKFNLLWEVSPFFLPLLQTGCFIGAVWGGFGFWLADNLKLKIIYQQMWFASLFIYLLTEQNFVWSAGFSVLLVCQYLAVSLIYYLYYQTNRTVSLSKLQNRHFAFWLPRLAAGGLFVIIFAFMADSIFLLYLPQKNIDNLLPTTLLYILAAAQLLHQLCSRRYSPESSGSKSPVKFIFWLLLLAGTAIVATEKFYILNNLPPEIAIKSVYISVTTAVVFIFLILMPVPPFIYRIYNTEHLQKNDIFNRIYHSLFIEPLQWCGRILAVLIDRMLAEKMIIGISSYCLQAAVRFFRAVHHNPLIGGTCFLLLLTLLLLFSYAAGGLN